VAEPDANVAHQNFIGARFVDLDGLAHDRRGAAARQRCCYCILFPPALTFLTSRLIC
jgi:hypothetical protein